MLATAGCGGSGSGGTKSVNPNTPEVNPAGDIPDNQAYVRYTPPAGGFSLKVPEGWSRSASAGSVTFSDKLNSVTVRSVPAKAAPSAAGAQATQVPKGATHAAASVVHRAAGSAVRVTYLAPAPPNPVTGKAVTDAVERYVFFHRGREVILTLAGPRQADNVDPWRLISNSVAWSA